MKLIDFYYFLPAYLFGDIFYFLKHTSMKAMLLSSFSQEHLTPS